MSYRAVPIRRPRAGDLARQIETNAVGKGLSLIPVVGSFLSPLAGPIVSAISDWFSAGEAGERFFHQVYLPKKATPMNRSSIRTLIFLRRKLMR